MVVKLEVESMDMFQGRAFLLLLLYCSAQLLLIGARQGNPKAIRAEPCTLLHPSKSRRVTLSRASSVTSFSQSSAPFTFFHVGGGTCTWLKGCFSCTISTFFPATATAEYLGHTAVSDSPVGKELRPHYRLVYNQRFGLHICQSFPIKNHSSIPCPPGY